MFDCHCVNHKLNFLSDVDNNTTASIFTAIMLSKSNKWYYCNTNHEQSRGHDIYTGM